jgi:hypothetical protein
MLHKGQDLQLIDIKSLLVRMREEKRSGCLRIYSRDHIALIFYRDGKPLGFFHDGATDIETTADSSLSVAKEPGAKVDVLVTRGDSEKLLADLMETGDIARIWGNAVAERRRQREKQEMLRVGRWKRVNLIAARRHLRSSSNWLKHISARSALRWSRRNLRR